MTSMQSFRPLIEPDVRPRLSSVVRSWCDPLLHGSRLQLLVFWHQNVVLNPNPHQTLLLSTAPRFFRLLCTIPRSASSVALVIENRCAAGVTLVV